MERGIVTSHESVVRDTRGDYTTVVFESWCFDCVEKELVL